MQDTLGLFIRYSEAKSFLFREVRDRLRQSAVDADDFPATALADIFEFFYMLAITGIDDGDRIAALAAAHNGECQRLIALPTADLAEMGLNRQKVRDAMFTDKGVRKLRANFEFGGAIDQSDVARFLFKHMSRETARKLLLLFGQAGLVGRHDAGDSVLIRPNGAAEAVFERYLRFLMLGTPASESLQ